MSAPYKPPSREFIPLEEVVKRVPNLGYQLYFASSKSNLEILAHVGIPCYLYQHWRLLFTLVIAQEVSFIGL